MSDLTRDTRQTVPPPSGIVPPELVTAATYSSTDLAAVGTGILDQVGSTPVLLLVDTGLVCSVNKTIPANCRLNFLPGAVVTIPNGVTLTVLAEPIASSDQQLWNCVGTGVVRYGAFVVKEFIAEHWGAIGDCNAAASVGTDNTIPLQKCADAAGACHALSPAIGTVLMRFKAGARYRTTAFSIPLGVSVNMEDSTLVAGIGLAGFSFGVPLVTIDGSYSNCTYKGLSVESQAISGTGHRFNPAYWETNIGIKFAGCQSALVTYGTVTGFYIGVQFTGPGIVSYSQLATGFFGSNKISVDIRTASAGFCNECSFYSLNIQSTSNLNAYGSIAGIRFSSDDNGLHGANNHHFDEISFQMANHSASFDWVSGTSKTQYSYYATAEKYWVFMGATSACGTDAPPPTDTVVFSNGAGNLLGTCANYVLQDGMVIFLTNSGGLTGAPTGTALYTWYWTVGTSGKTFNLALTKGGTPIVFTDIGSGTHSIEAQKNTQYTDNAGKVWLCEGVKFRAPIFIDDTSVNQCSVTKARWETGYGPFTHVQHRRRFTTTTIGNNLFEPYVLGTTPYLSHGDLNPPACQDVTKMLDKSFNVTRTYNTSAARVQALDYIARRYIKSPGGSTIAGMAGCTRTAWNTIQQLIGGADTSILCKDSILIQFGSSWSPVCFVDMAYHKKILVNADFVANSTGIIGKAYDSNFQAIACDNFTKAMCGNSRLQAGTGGYFDMISVDNIVAYGVPNIPVPTTRYIMVGLQFCNIRGLNIVSPEGEMINDPPLRVITPWGLSNDHSRSCSGAPSIGWFLQVGEVIKNIASTTGNPLGYVVKTAGALAPAWGAGATVIKDELRNNGGNVYAAQSAGTTGATPPTGTGVGFNDGTILWDWQCVNAVIQATATVYA